MYVALILVPAFAIVGLWLWIYSRRRRHLLEGFARREGLSYRPKDDGRLEETLNRRFALPVPLGRGFSGIRDIVEGGGIRMFRATEVLDLSPYGMPQNTHFGRIAVFFETERAGNLFFRVGRAGEFDSVLPGDRRQIEADPTFSALKDTISADPPPHRLSATVMNGGFLAYLEPVVTGGEKESDLKYLFGLAVKGKRRSGNDPGPPRVRTR